MDVVQYLGNYDSQHYIAIAPFSTETNESEMVYLFSENSFEKPAAFFHAHQSIKQISISTENNTLVLLLSRGFLVLDLPHLSFKMNFTPKEWLNYHHFDVSITGQLIASGDGFATVRMVKSEKDGAERLFDRFSILKVVTKFTPL